MAWNVMPVWVGGEAIDITFLNNIRLNFNETAPAKATGGTWPAHFADNGPNSIARREAKSDDVDSSDTTGSTTFTSTLTPNSGPSVSISTGLWAMVFTNASISNNGIGYSIASFLISGVTSSSATDNRGITNDIGAANRGIRAGQSSLASVTPGVNVFTMQFRVESGTGAFLRRRMFVMGW